MLTIAYLQVGIPEHGICRYGRLLAAEGRTRSGVRIVERNVGLSEDSSADRKQLGAVAAELGRADVVHLQVSVSGDGSWGSNARALRNLAVFSRQCMAPIVVTLHDVNNLRALRCTSAQAWLGHAGMELVKIPLRPGVRLLRQVSRGEIRLAEAFTSLTDFGHLYPYLVTRWVARRADSLLILSGAEKATLEATGLAGDVTVIPHFIENPPVIAEPMQACSTSARKKVVVAGFIFSSKGHELMVEAMALLPEIDVVFVGGPRLGGAASETTGRLTDLARRKGVGDHLHVTGYLPEKEFQRHLVTADLAVCPFEPDKSASGSLSSLIAAGCPVLASDTPLIAEYNAIVPGALPTFSPYTPAALAEAIRRVLGMPRAELSRPFCELRRQLSISTIYDLHLDVYRRTARRQGG